MSIFSKLFGSKKEAHAPGGSGESPEFTAFIQGSLQGLQMQNDAHEQTWGMSTGDRWDFDQDVGTLVFTFPDKIVSAPAQVIGSLSGSSNTWLWSWANSSIAEYLSKDAARVRDYGTEHGIERLTNAKWAATQQDGWEMTALAARICGANGGYRGPAGSSFVYFTFGQITIEPR